jgi:hypothetical protein
MKNIYSPASSVPLPSHMTSRSTTKSHLYFDSSFDIVTSDLPYTNF